MDVNALLLRPRLLADGWSDGELSRRRRSGELVSLRRGAYLDASDERLADAAATHRLLIASGGPLLAEESVVSHVSAAVMHGIPVWGLPLHRVHRTRSRRTGARRSDSAHLHAAPLDAAEIVEIGGRLVTAVARTVVDIARTATFEEAVAMADAALHHRMVDRPTLDAALVRAAGWRGIPQARRVIDFSDGRSESVGESRSRVAMARFGLPVPLLQWTVCPGGTPLGRVDFGWPELRTVGEFDGRVKYGKYLRPGQDPGDAVFEEKQREDRLRDEGLRVVRWTWKDLNNFTTVATRLRRAFAAS